MCTRHYRLRTGIIITHDHDARSTRQIRLCRLSLSWLQKIRHDSRIRLANCAEAVALHIAVKRKEAMKVRNSDCLYVKLGMNLEEPTETLKNKTSTLPLLAGGCIYQ